MQSEMWQGNSWVEESSNEKCISSKAAPLGLSQSRHLFAGVLVLKDELWLQASIFSITPTEQTQLSPSGHAAKGEMTELKKNMFLIKYFALWN